MSGLIPRLTRKGSPQKTFHTLGVLLYVLLGIASAWHAPHFFRNEVALDADRHESHETVRAEACALCTVKTVSQIVSSGFAPPGASLDYVVLELSAVQRRLNESVFTARPRAPPAHS